MHLVGYLYEDYHDARSLEHKVDKRVFYLSGLSSSKVTNCRSQMLEYGPLVE
jgi:hypothetical protein